MDRDLNTLLPLKEGYLAFVPATIALEKLGCARAEQQASQLLESEDTRVCVITAKCLRLLSGCDRIGECELGRTGVNEQAMAIFRRLLANSELEARRSALKSLLEQPTGDAFADIAPLLVDENHAIRGLAARCLRVSATRDEKALGALFPYLEYESSPTTDQSRAKDLSVRQRAIESLCFEHGSNLVQNKLVAVFDRPGFGLKKHLTSAFRFCPARAELKQAMLERTRDANPENALSAWFVLGTLKDPGLRPHFQELLSTDNALLVQAGVLGLYQILAVEDIPFLEMVQGRWRPESFSIR